MNKDSADPIVTCPNCQRPSDKTYCSFCGQKTMNHSDRSFIRLIKQFLGNLFFLDSRSWMSFRYLVLRPGKMTVEFLEGKRAKFLPPITLFLFINLIYFFFSPISDYALPLYDQVNQQGHSKIAKKMIDKRLDERNLTFSQYQDVYNPATNNLSKILMILNIPIIALFVYLISFKRKGYNYDSLIFSIHFFTLFLLSICVGDLLDELDTNDLLGVTWMLTFLLAVPLIYLTLSFKTFIKTNWLLSAGASIFIIIGLVMAQFLYRAVIFFVTFFTT